MKKHNILVILASPRKGSNSALAALYLAGITDSRLQISNLNTLNIHPCTACDKCENTFKCVFNDDAGKLIRKIEKADVVIVASPVYFTGVPGVFKVFIDRNQSVWNKQNSKLKAENLKLKQGIIILTQGDNKPKYFRPAESEIRSFFAVNGIKTKAVLKFTSMDRQKSILSDKKALKKIKAAAGLIHG